MIAPRGVTLAFAAAGMHMRLPSPSLHIRKGLVGLPPGFLEGGLRLLAGRGCSTGLPYVWEPAGALQRSCVMPGVTGLSHVL